MSDPTQLRERARQAANSYIAGDGGSVTWDEWKAGLVDAVLAEVAVYVEERRNTITRLGNATNDPQVADCWETAAIQLNNLLSVLRPSEGSKE